MKRNLSDWCHVCAARPRQRCYDDNDRVMRRHTHDVPGRISRWDAYDGAIAKGELRKPGILPRSDLSVEAILRATAPEGTSTDAWADVLCEAIESAAVWEDPWADGSAGWREFLGLPEEPINGNDSVEEARLFDDASKSDFLECLDLTWPAPKGAMKSRVAVLRAVARYARDDGSNAFPAQATIAKEAKVSVSTVKNALTWARSEGWLVETERVGKDVAKWQLRAPGSVHEPLQIAA